MLFLASGLLLLSSLTCYFCRFPPRFTFFDLLSFRRLMLSFLCIEAVLSFILLFLLSWIFCLWAPQPKHLMKYFLTALLLKIWQQNIERRIFTFCAVLSHGIDNVTTKPPIIIDILIIKTAHNHSQNFYHKIVPMAACFK